MDTPLAPQLHRVQNLATPGVAAATHALAARACSASDAQGRRRRRDDGGGGDDVVVCDG